MDTPQKDFFPDMIRGWLVLQRSGLSESSKKTVLGSSENTLGRSRIVELSNNIGQITSFWFSMEIVSETGNEKCELLSKEKQTSGSQRRTRTNQQRSVLGT